MAQMCIRKERGAVLLLAILFLVLLAMVAATVMQTSILELHMAGNDEHREQAFQEAQAIAGAIFDNADNFPTNTSVGQKICAPADTDGRCVEGHFLSITPAAELADERVLVEFRVQRLGPLMLSSPPIRKLQRDSSSSLAYGAALFEAHVVVDGQGVGQGRAEVVHGVAVLIASATQGRWESR